jgi:sugar phosphate isomerase/epimerase
MSYCFYVEMLDRAPKIPSTYYLSAIMTRRHFISSSVALSASTLLDANNMEHLAEVLNPFELPEAVTKVPVMVLATNWGFPGTLEDFCKKAKEEGYVGFENWIPMDERQRSELLNTATKYGLSIGFLAGSGNPNFEEHLRDYEAQVRMAVAQKPLYVNTHAGRDFFTVEQNIQLLKVGIKISQESGVPVLCETHRGRCAYNAPVTRQYMDALPDLRITADLSHWCVVHESLLDGFDDTLAKTLDRTGHIHARIGHAEGPQVNDPRAPEWTDAVRSHFGWWDRVMENASRAKRPYLTFLCEFGPVDYLPALPYTRQPVADQWAVNAWMMKAIRERYA